MHHRLRHHKPRIVPYGAFHSAAIRPNSLSRNHWSAISLHKFDMTGDQYPFKESLFRSISFDHAMISPGGRAC
jgi:hypothetical protein